MPGSGSCVVALCVSSVCFWTWYVSSMFPSRASYTDAGLLVDTRGHTKYLIKSLVSHLSHSGEVTGFKSPWQGLGNRRLTGHNSNLKEFEAKTASSLPGIFSVFLCSKNSDYFFLGQQCAQLKELLFQSSLALGVCI